MEADVAVERVVDWLRVWWVEATLGAVGLVGLAVGVGGGDALTLVLALALAVAVADRLRLRLDNRSLAAAVREVRDGDVSAMRRGTGRERADDATDEAEDGGETTGTSGRS